MWEQELVEALNGAVNGEKQRIISGYMQMTGKSAATLYRIARKHGYASGRKTRCDAGECQLTDMQLSYISSLIQQSAREIKGTIMPVEEALMLAEENGIVEKGLYSAAWVSKLLRDRNMHRAALDAPEPKCRMRSLHPNHVHVVDASICIQFYLKGRLRIMREDKFYKNKWKNFVKVRRKLMRYILADHCSHTIFVKYYYESGEKKEILFDFLVCAWSGNKHPKWPFCGVPFVMLWDRGAANISGAIRQWMERLDIEVPEPGEHNPSRQGSAEKAQEIVESRFESKLKFQPATTVDELNAWALDWAVHYNGTQIHRRHKKTRTQNWLTIKPYQLRELPDMELLKDAFAEPEVQRKVTSDYTISILGKPFNLKHIPNLIPNLTWVKVIKRPLAWPQIGVVHEDVEYLVNPIGHDQHGFLDTAATIGQEFKSPPESTTQQHKKRGDNLAYGEDRPKDAVPFAGGQFMGHRSQQIQHHFLPRAGRPLEIKSGDVETDKQLPVITLIRDLARSIDMTPELNQTIRQHYGTTITTAEHQRLLDVAADTGTITIENLKEGGHDTAQAIAV